MTATALTLTSCGDGVAPEEVNTEWHEAFDAEETGWLLSTWGSSETNRYAVGGDLQGGVIMHLDGQKWRREGIDRNTPLLNWVHGFSADNIYAVGAAGTILHFDGNEWSAEESPTGEDLWGVWGVATDELWAVGGSGRSDAEPTLLFYDGDDWEEIELPEFSRDDIHALFKIWGTAANNVFVVGQKGLLLQYDGETWKEVPVGATDDLIAVWGTGPDDVLAVGGRGNGVVSHYNGKKWNTEVLFDLPGINGVWMQKPGVAHLAVARGRLAKLTIDGFVLEDHTPQNTLDFHGLFGVDGVLTAVGGNLEELGATELIGVAYERYLGKND